MGDVFRGHDDTRNRPVVLKRLRSDFQASTTERRRFRREIEITAELRHSGIVEAYEWLHVDGCDWLILEWLDGRGLDRVIARGALDIERARSIARQVAEALAMVHDAGFVYRDLKPANIITLRTDSRSVRGERVKLIDFGLAKPITADDTEAEDPEAEPPDLTAEGHVPGTLAWMSPEQAMGLPADPRSDLFALGSLLYAMLGGRAPFDGHGKLETLRRVCTVRERPLGDLVPGLPRGLIVLVDRLLDKDPERRPRDARAVVEALAPGSFRVSSSRWRLPGFGGGEPR